MDSNLVIKQFSWEWKIKKDELRKTNDDIITLIKDFKIKMSYNCIRREENKEVHEL